MAIKVITPPAVNAISLSLVKEHLRILGADDDTALEGLYIPSAIANFEAITGRALITQTVEETFDQFPACSSYFLLERGSPLQSVTHVKYWASDDTLKTFDAASYFVSTSTLPGTICLKTGYSWPSDIHPTRLGAVVVTYVVGYGASDSNVPADIKQALSLLIGDLYRNREDSVVSSGVSRVDVNWPSVRLAKKYRTFYYQLFDQSRK